jgi:hypothetical protein
VKVFASRLLRLCIVAVGCLCLSGCFGETYTVRYRLTLVVQVDGHVRTGSSVVQVYYIDQAPWHPQWTDNVRGEATYVDLGSRGVLICLLTDDPKRRTGVTDPASIPVMYFPSFFENGLSSDTSKGGDELNALNKATPKTDVSFDMLQMMVWFPNTGSPAGGTVVDPTNLSAALGNELKLLRATVEITDEPVTWRIMEKTALDFFAHQQHRQRKVAAKFECGVRTL